jgi:hypothetical protein
LDLRINRILSFISWNCRRSISRAEKPLRKNLPKIRWRS